MQCVFVDRKKYCSCCLSRLYLVGRGTTERNATRYTYLALEFETAVLHHASHAVDVFLSSFLKADTLAHGEVGPR